MRTVAVVLGDNDFSQTFRNLLETIHRLYIYKGNAGTSNESVMEAIVEGAIYHYRTFQGGKGNPSFNGLVVLFDEEAESDILTKDHNHGAWYLHFDSGQIGSY